MNPKQVEFLRSIKEDPRWIEILNELERIPPTYRPDDDTEEAKLEAKFKYESGVYRENQRILQILRSN